MSFPSSAFCRKSKLSKGHIWLAIDNWSLTALIRNSFRGRTEFRKTTMTSGRRILRYPTPTPSPLLIFDRRPSPWYKFLSFHSLPLPLISKMAAIFSLRKYWALARQKITFTLHASSSHNHEFLYIYPQFIILFISQLRHESTWKKCVCSEI